jgi:hypothetical protein
MTRCPVCSTGLDESAISCPSCGASLTVAPPTIKQPSPKSPVRRNWPGYSESTTTTSGRGSFVAGTILDGRYRIISLLGRGGMGEVYKAEDLKLDHVVALKFLPDHLSDDSRALTRFRKEVRIARQVTHPNVCRVFDIGEFENRHFLSMEFIDGEDLSSLLRRIGRLPADKALEVSRQMCAGLAAAHGAGVLHRDLKPANVMIDGRGKARITDFGIAGLEEELKKGGGVAGTPAYMSPEQTTGRELTVQSDIYSLGLILYELFTGKPAFEPDSVSELVRKHRSVTPTNPSEILKEIDPLVERIILQCLEKNPDDRPRSALQVAMMLPGGNPLEAALAAGETPSPEMVAAAPKKGALKPAIAIACLLGGIGMLAICIYGSMKFAAQNRIPFNKSPEVLSERANEIAQKLGYTDMPADTEYVLDYDEDYYEYAKRNPSPETWNKISTGQPLMVVFRQRQSPRYLKTVMELNGDWSLAPQTESGMRTIWLDTRGRLVRFVAVPPEITDKANQQTQPDWSTGFSASELDPAKFKETDPRWTPAVAYDARKAWAGVLPDHPEIPLQVEAAAFQGKLVSLQLIYPWSVPETSVYKRTTTRDWIAMFLFAGIAIAILITAIFLARRHVKSGSADRKGAFKTALIVLVLTYTGKLLSSSHVPSFFAELDRHTHALRFALYVSAITWLTYLALEPIIRRNLPQLIVSWNRLLAGDWRDPLVGRDILFGALIGVGHFTLICSAKLSEYFLTHERGVLTFNSNQSILGLRNSISVILYDSGMGMVYGLMFICWLAILYLVFRRLRYAGAVMFLLISTVETLFFSRSLIYLPFTLGISLLLVLAFSRIGLLAAVVTMIVFGWMQNTLFTFNFSAWYATPMMLTLLVILLLLGFGLKISLANQSVFGARMMTDKS